MFLRRVGRPLMMMARLKETTGIFGLDVVPNAREVLIGLYTRTLDEIKAVPEEEGYRKAVESFTRHRLQVCWEEEDWEAIEKRLGCGQVEELIEEAEDELKLMSKMIEWDPWGIPDDYECEVENDAPVPKHVPLHRPGPFPEEFHNTLKAVETGTLQYAISASEKNDDHGLDAKETKNFAEWILKIGDGVVEESLGDGEAEVTLSDDILLNDVTNPMAIIVQGTYPNKLHTASNPEIFKDRAVLVPTNEIVDYVMSFAKKMEK